MRYQSLEIISILYCTPKVDIIYYCIIGYSVLNTKENLYVCIRKVCDRKQFL